MKEPLCKSCKNYGKYPISKYEISLCPYCKYEKKKANSAK